MSNRNENGGQKMVFGALQKKRDSVAVLTALIMLLSLLTGVLYTGSPGGLPPLPFGGDSRIAQLGAVTIKTQQAANNVPGGIRGIDVSHYQGNIDWSKVAQDNVNFAMIRASFGQETDKNFYKNVQGATNAGLKVGAYHYAKFSDRSSMLKEAQYFLNVLDSVQAQITYPIVLDLEGNVHKSMGRNTLTPLAVEFMNKLTDKGYTVMIYSNDNFFRDYLSVSSLGDYEFWVANYMAEPNRGQAMWQHTSYGSVSGISGRVDINIAYKDLSVKKGVVVSTAISNTIKATLNERHGAGLPLEGLDMAVMKETVVTILQNELVRQLDANLAITGEMNAQTLDYLEQVPFTYMETQGNITYLCQVMLFYKGFYKENLNGTYDAYMLEALKGFQAALEISATGELNRDTLWYLFR